MSPRALLRLVIDSTAFALGEARLNALRPTVFATFWRQCPVTAPGVNLAVEIRPNQLSAEISDQPPAVDFIDGVPCRYAFAQNLG